MRRFVVLLLLAGGPALAATPLHPRAVAREGEIIVQWRDGVVDKALDLRTRYGLTVERELVPERIELLRLPAVTGVEQALVLLRADPAVESAEPNFLRFPRAVVPNDPLFPQQWGLRNTGQPNFFPGGPAGIPGADLNMVQAWDADGDGVPDRVGDASTIVAIIDDAIDTDHGEFAGRIVAPHDFRDADSDPRPTSADESHGTMVTGCVGARGNNGTGVAGIAWNTSLMPLRFAFDTASELAAINYARDHGAQIINASFGGPGFSASERDTIAAFPGLFVAAAGNDDSNIDKSQLSYPSNLGADNIVAVAATNRQDDIASFSQYGPLSVDVAAPGLQIVTTAPGNQFTVASNCGQDNGSCGVSGTSFASPYVAGVAALLHAHVAGIDVPQMKARLIESGSAVAGANPKQRTVGGRVDADRALELAARPSLVIRSVAFSDGGNDQLDPGETLGVDIVVGNLWQGATGVTATLAAGNGVTVTSGPVSLGAIAAGGQATAHFDVDVDAGIASHRYVTFTLSLAAAGGYTAQRSFIEEVSRLTLGTPVTQTFAARDVDLYDEFQAWHFDITSLPAGTQTLVIRTATANGTDIDLLAKQGVPPQYNITVGIDPEVDEGFFCTSGTASDCQDPATEVSGRLDGNEAITIVNPGLGTYHLVVVNFAQLEGGLAYTLSAQLFPGDLRPDPFGIGGVDEAAPGAVVTSSPVSVAGISAPTFVTVAGNGVQYNVNGGAFTSAEGSVHVGDQVRVRMTVGADGTTQVGQLTIGGETSTWAVKSTTTPVTPPAVGGGGGGGGGALDLALLLPLALLGRRRRRA